MIQVDDNELAPGQRIAGRFRLAFSVGEGGMSVVWAAHDDGGDLVALKFVKRSAADSPSRERRLLREARILERLAHPNVVAVREVGRTEAGTPFLVMDLLRGEPLSARLKREGALPLHDVASIFEQVLVAIAAAHDAGVIHRDIKPENVFLTGDLARVLDFGIARVLAPTEDGEPDALTATGAMMGTPYYMAPEQIFGERDVDRRVDVWALGVVLAECLTGRRPTQASGVGQIIKLITQGPLPRLSDDPSVPPELAAIVDRMLSRDRERRPSLPEVRAIVRDVGRHAHPAKQPRSAPHDAELVATLDSIAPGGAPPRPSTRAGGGEAGRGWMVGWGAAASVVAAIAVGWAASGTKTANTTPIPTSAAAPESPPPPAPPTSERGGEARAVPASRLAERPNDERLASSIAPPTAASATAAPATTSSTLRARVQATASPAPRPSARLEAAPAPTTVDGQTPPPAVVDAPRAIERPVDEIPSLERR